MSSDVEQIILGEIREMREDIKTIMIGGCSKASSHADVETRVRSLESDRNRACGIIASVSLIFGICGAWVAKKLGL